MVNSLAHQQPSVIISPFSELPVHGLPGGEAFRQIAPDNAVFSHVKDGLHNELKGPNAFLFDQNKFFDTLPLRGRQVGGDVLTYNWEGTSIGTKVPDVATLNDTAEPPFFQSYEPVSSATKTFPRLLGILDGSNFARGDKLPSVGIATTHRLTVRDGAGGGTHRGDITVTVGGSSGPFLETTTLAGSYPGNTSQTITWSVNNTTAPPVSCANYFRFMARFLADLVESNHSVVFLPS